MQHLEEGEIHAWLDGALSDAEGTRIEQHVATCKECAAMVADARGLIAGAARIVSALDHVPGGVIPKSSAATVAKPLWRALRLTPFRAAMAASLIVAAGSLIVVQRKDQELMVPQAASMSAPAVAMDAAVSAAPNAAPSPAAGATAPAVPPPSIARATVAAGAPVPTQPQALNEMRQQQAPQPPQLALQRQQQGQEAQPERAREDLSSKTTIALSDSTLLLRGKTADGRGGGAEAKVASADVTDERAKKERDSIASTANAATVGALRSAAPGAREAARDAKTDIAGRRAPPAVLRLESVVTTSGFAERSVAFAGCYQVVDSAAWPAALPKRFTLGDTSTRVRSANDSIVGSWIRSALAATVRFSENVTPSSFTIQRGAEGFVAMIGAQPPAIFRLTRDCP